MPSFPVAIKNRQLGCHHTIATFQMQIGEVMREEYGRSIGTRPDATSWSGCKSIVTC
jgi:hypothetical protein